MTPPYIFLNAFFAKFQSLWAGEKDIIYIKQKTRLNLVTNPELTGKVWIIILKLQGNRLPNWLRINKT